MICTARLLTISLIALVAIAGCASSATAPSTSPAAGGPTSAPGATKRIVAGMMGQPSVLVDRFETSQITVPGGASLEMLVNAGLTELNEQNLPQPLLAEDVPSLDNGLWQLLPDGTMQTTWVIKQNAQWQDGAPLTADDYVFTTTVDRDNDVPLLRPVGYQWVQDVRAADPRTVVVTWSGPYIDADKMFEGSFASPLPKHLLESTYLSDKSAFVNLPFWSQEFVGTGPFSVKQFTPGTSIVLAANPGFVLGRPKIDEIEVRFITDANTLVTNLLAGSVELSIGRGFTAENALQLREQWPNGHMIYRTALWITLMPQFINPSPAVVGDLRFRQALMYGTDRQQLVDTLQGGLGGVADVMLGPAEPYYADVRDSAVTYPYDPARATQMIAALGYTKGADGVFRDSQDQPLTIEVRSNGEKITENTIVPVTNMWSGLGIAAQPLLVPLQRITDREYVATFPAFRMMRQPNTASSLTRMRSSFTPLPENRFAGSNYARYQDPAFDSLLDQFNATIPLAPRLELMRQVLHYISTNLNTMGLFYDGDFEFASNRLKNITEQEGGVWDVVQWDATP